jgi:hypothetical protein
MIHGLKPYPATKERCGGKQLLQGGMIFFITEGRGHTISFDGDR